MEILFTATEVETRIRAIAEEIITDYKAAHPLFVCLLKGAAPFASALMTEITRLDPDFHPEMDYMTISTYGDGRTAGQSRVVMDLAPNTVVSGRTVIVLDDCLDKGHTAHFTGEHLRLNGAADVKLVVLAQKEVERENDLSADIYGFIAPDTWLVGMGMDDTSVAKEARRWLDYIAAVK